MSEQRGWGLLPPKEIREQKEREWAASMDQAREVGEQFKAMRRHLPTNESEGWTACELEDHVEEVRTRNDDLSRLLTERPFDSQVLDSVWLEVEAVRELLEHCAGLHAPDVLVRVLES